MTAQEIVFDEDYTEKRYTYGLTYRPIGVSCQPDGFIIGSNREHKEFYFGTIDYPFKLTEKQIVSYELTKVEQG